MKKKISKKYSNNILEIENLEEEVPNSNIYEMQSQNEINSVEIDSSLNSKKIKIAGLYDPEDYDLKIDMWSNSNGDQLKYLFSNLANLKLSDDASNLMNIAILTNAYYPQKNMTEKEFLKIKSDWLIKNKDRDLIEEYLIKNQVLNLNPELSKYLINQHLSESNVDQSL